MAKKAKMDDTSKLKHLGSKKTKYLYEHGDESLLETFDNLYLGNDYHIVLSSNEFTSLCPKTGQPDFARIEIDYIPSRKCIETKSLKLYLFSFRNYKGFMESITNKILDDLVNACDPVEMKVTAHFNSRGGIKLKVVAET